MNKFVSFLEKVGHDFKVGLDKALPIAEFAATTVVPLVFPALGPVFQTTVGVITQTEQKFAAMGLQNGTGAQKLAEATTILQPVLAQALNIAGKSADLPTIQAYISAVVMFLNAVPAGPMAPAA